MAKWSRARKLGPSLVVIGAACHDEPSTWTVRPEASATVASSAPISLSASAAIPDPSSLHLPSSVPPEEVARAIVLRVTRAGVFAGDEKIESGDHDRLERLDGVVAFLRARREERRAAEPARPFGGVVILDIDDDTPAILVKCTFQSAAFAGFPNVGFAPRRRP